MPDDPLDVPEKLGIPPPCYVRKVDRPGHWGNSEDDLDTRVNDALESIFKLRNRGLFSIYRVESSDDLRRVAVGLNSMRGALTEKLYLLAIREKDLESLELRKVSGDTLCHHANILHRDVAVDDLGILRTMVKNMMLEGRATKKLNARLMGIAVELARRDQCDAIQGTAKLCVCQS